MGVLCAGGVSSGIYPTDSVKQVEYLVNDSRTKVIFVEDDEQLDKVLECRGRCPTLEKIVVFDMEGLAAFADPMVVSLDAFIDLRPPAHGRQRRPVGADDRLARTEGSRDPGLHLGHDRPAQGRDAYPSQRLLPDCARGHAVPGARERRAAAVPAAVPRRRADRRLLLQPRHRLDHELRREPGDGARQHPRGAADRVPRRAARLGEILLGGHDRAEGCDAAGEVDLQQGDRRRLRARRRAAGGRRAVGAAEGEVPGRLLAGAAQHPQGARHRPLPIPVHRRGADRAGTDPLVPRARHEHVRGLRPDRELRRRDHHAARPDQARHRRQGRAVGARSSCRRRTRSCCAANSCSRATSTSRRRPPRPSTRTAGCIPATSARSTIRAL